MLLLWLSLCCGRIDAGRSPGTGDREIHNQFKRLMRRILKQTKFNFQRVRSFYTYILESLKTRNNAASSYLIIKTVWQLSTTRKQLSSHQDKNLNFVYYVCQICQNLTCQNLTLMKLAPGPDPDLKNRRQTPIIIVESHNFHNSFI